MTLDNEAQRTLLLGMFNTVNFPGNLIDEAYLLKHTIATAPVIAPGPDPVPPPS